MPRRLLALLAVLCTALPACAQTPQAQPTDSADAPRNVVLFIADGAGPATMTMARDFLRDQEGRSTLALDSIYVGSIRTFATDSKVTDSAAGATAFAAGVKTYNGAISVDPERQPVATVLEAAEQRGIATGLVATSRLTHATPAAFAAHVPLRSQEDEIARQMLAQDIEVLLGGGRRHFQPDTAGTRNLMREAEAAGYAVFTDRAGFDAAQETPLLGLFADSHMAYEIDRDPAAQPSLAEMTAKALDLLSEHSAGSEHGFFLVVEGSRIDHAAHGNDAAAHLRDMLAYDAAVAAALDFAEQDGETLLVSTADHETGGLTLGRTVDGRGVYAWEPPVLARVEGSHGAMMQRLADSSAAPAAVLQEMAGIDSLGVEEEAALDSARTRDDGRALSGALAEIIGRRAIVGWTTSGHTAVDVNVYAAGPGAQRFAGHHDNTYIGQALADLLGFDLEALTQQLREEMAAQTEAREATGE